MPDTQLHVRNHLSFVKNTYKEAPKFQKLLFEDFCSRKLPELGDGSGVKVCLIETGRADHPYLGTTVMSSVLGDSNSPEDFLGHATASAGIICANDTGSMIGFAPQTKLIFAKATDDIGFATPITIAASVLWGLATKSDIIVIPFIFHAEIDILWEALRKAVNSNVVVIVEKPEEGVSLPDGVVVADSIKTISTNILTTYLNDEIVTVSSDDFRPAIIAGISSLLLERLKATKKRCKATTVAKNVISVLAGDGQAKE